MDKRFLGILGAIIVIFIAIFAISQNSNNSNNSGSNTSGAKATNHVEGNGKAGVTLVEYGDYECPICENYYLPLKQAVAQYNDQIHFQFRNLPLTAIHQNALAGAKAAEAAGLQDKYWQMHDKLYDNQNSWVSSSSPIDQFTQYAQAIGLDVSKFKTDFASNQVNDSVNADLTQFPIDFKAATGSYDRNKDMATPTFFLDGKYLANTSLIDSNGAASADKIGAAIKAEIDTKSKQ